MQIVENNQKSFDQLVDWFRHYESCIVSFSAGVDSSLLALCAKNALGKRSFAVTSVSPSFSEVERTAAEKIAQEIGIELIVVMQDDLGTKGYVENDVNRCYFCRNNLTNAILPIARKLSISVCVDGTHKDDMRSPRPGIKALREAGFKAPYLELGFNKESIRAMAKSAGISNWDRPSEACLSSRIAFGQRIDLKTLRVVEMAEETVKKLTGAKIVRVRTINDKASVEVDKDSLKVTHEMFSSIQRELKLLGYREVVMDPNGYSSGKMLELFVKDNA